MNTILLSFVIVVTLVNLALALSTFGYIVEMNKHMEEWFKMFGMLTEACSGLCEENGHVITSLIKHIEYTEKEFTEKETEVQELNDKYDKLYEEFKKLEEAVDECRDYRFEKYLKGLDPDYLLELQSEKENERDDDEKNDDGLSSFWHEEEDIGGQNGNSNNT